MFDPRQESSTAEAADHAEKDIECTSREAPNLVFFARSACSAVDLAFLPSGRMRRHPSGGASTSSATPRDSGPIRLTVPAAITSTLATLTNTAPVP